MENRFVLRNVKRLNGEEIDIVVENGKIAEVINAGEGRGQQVYDRSGMYVSSGWIDLHVHAFPEFDPYGDEVDKIGVKQGVTTIVDAGSCGADRISDLAASSQKSLTRLFAFLNISRVGLKRVDELSDLKWIDEDKVLNSVNLYQDFIVGLKARISSSVVSGNGVKPLKIARQLSSKTSLPLMVHIGSAPPDIEEVIPLLEKHDIVTHFLNGKDNNLFDKNGSPLPVFKDAIMRGVHFDVGHGTSSFSFKFAEAAKRNDIHFNTISTDIYRGNRLNGPVYSMANVLSKFLYLGYSLEEVVGAVTRNAADWLGKPELGRIKAGDNANLTLFTLEDHPAVLIDSDGEGRVGNKEIEAKGVIVHDRLIEC